MFKFTQCYVRAPNRAAFLALCGSLLFAGSSQGATLFGSTVTETAYYPTLSNLFGQTAPETVGSSVEFPADAIAGIDYFETDVTADQIVFHPLASPQFGTAQFNGLVLEFSGAPEIEGVSLDSTSVFPTLPFGFTPNSVTFNLSGIQGAPAENLVLDVSFSKSVPEPPTWIMLVAGFAGIGLAGRHAPRRAFA